MTSVPPEARKHESRPPIGLATARLAFCCREESAVCFTIEGAGMEHTTSVPEADGGLFIETTIAGRIERIAADHLLVVRGSQKARVRYLLPSVVDLSALLGAEVQITVGLRFSAARRPTVDAMIYDRDGHPWLWARDGLLPTDQPFRPAVRMAHGRGGPRLAFAQQGLPARLGMAECADIDTGDGRAIATAVRIEDEDAAFFLIWR